MKLVNKNIHYAIKSLLYFCRFPAKVISVSELVNVLNMRRAFLRRILQALSKRRILKSLKGSGGGFIFNLKPQEIRIIDVINIFRDHTDIIGCLSEKDICPHPDHCLLMRNLKNIESQLNNTLSRLTIAELFKSIDRRSKKSMTKGGPNK